MAWYDSEAEYYQEPAGALRQGDLLLAPTAVLEPGNGDNPSVSPFGLGDERSVQVWTSGSNQKG